MPQLHDLIWLSFATVIYIFHLPRALVAHSCERIIELECFTFICGVFEHTFYLTIFHQPADFGGKVKLLAVGAD